MVLVDAGGLPVAVDTMSATRHEGTLVQGLFEFMLTQQTPDRIVGDKAYGSESLDHAMADRGIDLIAPHKADRKPENKTQDGRSVRRYHRRWTIERTIGWIQNRRRLYIRWKKSAKPVLGYLHLSCALLLLREVSG